MKTLKKKLMAARLAWIKAVNEKAKAEVITGLKTALDLAQKAFDDGLATATTEEITEEITGNTEQAAPGKAAGNEVTPEELAGVLNPMVKAAVLEAVGEKFGAQVTDASVQAAIEAAFAKQATSPVAGKAAAHDMKAICTAAVAEAIANIKKDGKMVFANASNPGVSGDDDGTPLDLTKSQVTIPDRWTKGNLPLHGRQLLNVLMQRNINDGIDAAVLTKGEKLSNAMFAKLSSCAQGRKAMTSTGSNAGDELVPTLLSAEIQRRFYLSSDLAAMVLRTEIEMPSQPYEYPLLTTRPQYYLNSTENTSTTESNPGTDKITLTAKKLMAQINVSYELDEDAIIPVIPVIQEQLAEAAGAAYEHAFINGDTTGTHQDYDINLVANHPAKGFDGLRKLALAVAGLKVDLSTGGLTEANVRSVRKALGKYGVKLDDLVWIAGPNGYNDMMGITNVSTMEKFGPRATIVTGELAAFANIPIIVSEQAREDLNASGVFDNSTKSKGSLLVVNLANWLFGRRRDFTIETFRNVQSQQYNIVASFRRAMNVKETPSATVPAVAIGYNYTA